MPEPPANPKAGDLAQDCRNGSNTNQGPDIDVMCSGSEKRSCDQSRLGRQRKPNALKRDECCDQPDASDVGREELIRRINRTNSSREIEPGVTITDAIARRDVLRLRRGLYAGLADAAATEAMRPVSSATA